MHALDDPPRATGACAQCGHHRAKHQPACIMDDARCGCRQFQPVPTAMPTRATVAAELVAARDALLTAERELLSAAGHVLRAKGDLALSERAYLLQEPTQIMGKNEVIRAAQLAELTTRERLELERVEWWRIQAASALEQARVTFSAVKVLARLVTGE